MTQPEEEPRRECPMCAGTGKVRDYGFTLMSMTASTFYTVDPTDFNPLNIVNMCGT